MFAVNLKISSAKWTRHGLSTFSRTSVCNVFLVSKLCYVVQILHCARSDIQKFYRRLALLIWNSGSEPMWRYYLFRCVESGRLGLAHFFSSQIESRFLLLRVHTNPFFTHNSLTKIRRSQAAGVFSKFVVFMYENYSLRLKGFIKEIADALSFLYDHVSLVSQAR